MRGRHLTTAVTLLVLTGILVAGALVGSKALFAPMPSDQSRAGDGPSCTRTTLKKGQTVRAREVQVSVFNGGSRAGLATETMGALRNRGFDRGSIGNAPEGTVVRKVQVWTTQRDDVAARLVANQFGPRTRVHVVASDLGPGIDVVVGDALKGLSKARTTIVVAKTSSTCVPLPSPTAGS